MITSKLDVKAIKVSDKLEKLKHYIFANDFKKAKVYLEEIQLLGLDGKAGEFFEVLNNLYFKKFPVELSKSICGLHWLSPTEEKLKTFEGGKRINSPTKIVNVDSLPLVSIITVVYNGAETLTKCLDSVLAQTYQNIEYIVIDGNSTDGTLNILKDYEEKLSYVISEPDKGIYDAMNKGLSFASGDYIAFLNSDDYYLSTAVEDSIRFIQRNDVDLCFSAFNYVNEDGYIIIADEPRPWNESLLIQGIPGGHETIFAHKSCYDLIGAYDCNFAIVADYHWMTRAFNAGLKAKGMAKTTLVMNVGGASFSADVEKRENLMLLEQNFGSLDSDMKEFLYSLKFYKNWDGFGGSDETVIAKLRKAEQHSPLLHKALFLTIENRKSELSGVIKPVTKRHDESLAICIALTFLKNASGGAERIAIEAANELNRRGHSVTVVCCHGLGGEPYYKLDSEISLIDLAVKPYEPFYMARSESWGPHFEDITGRKFDKLNYQATKEDFEEWRKNGHLWRTKLYHAFFQEHKFDTVLSFMPSTYPYTLLNRETDDQTKHIACLHNSPDFKFYSKLYPAESDMERYMRLIALENADQISVLFDEYVDQMPEVYRSKCFVLPNYASEEIIHYKADTSENKTILNIGRLSDQKNQKSLIKAYAIVKKKYPDWELNIYGDGPLRTELEVLCNELLLDSKKILKGTNRNVGSLYGKASIFAFPSLFEGFPLTLVEAMNFSLPSIGFKDCEGVKYLLANGEGLLLDRQANDHIVLAEAIIKLIENEPLRIKLGKQANEKAKLYSLSNHADIVERMCHYSKSVGRYKPVYDKSNISVAILSTYIEGGAGIAANRLKACLNRNGSNAKMISFSESPESIDYKLSLPKHWVNVYQQCMSLPKLGKMEEGSTLFSSGYPSVDFGQISFLKHVDIINLHWVQTMLSNEAISYIANLNKPVVWTLHDMAPFTGGCHYSDGCVGYESDCGDCPMLNHEYKTYPEKVLNSKVRYWPDNITVVAPSKWLAECARRSAVFRNCTIRVIPNAVDINVFKPLNKLDSKKSLGIPENKKVLLFTCQSHGERRKGFSELVELTRLLNRSGNPQDFHVITFGYESNSLKDIELPYTALGHISKEEELAVGYSAADITILPTLEDNLPNVILESIACGTPVVSFDSGGCGDAVVDNVTGYLVPKKDVLEMSKAIFKALRQDLSDSCRSYAIKHYSPEVQAYNYQELFFELKNKNISFNPRPREIRVFTENEEAYRSLFSNSSNFKVC